MTTTLFRCVSPNHPAASMSGERDPGAGQHFSSQDLQHLTTLPGRASQPSTLATGVARSSRSVRPRHRLSIGRHVESAMYIRRCNCNAT